MQKVIFIDVDGTLRNDKREITDRTCKALKKVNSIGYETILCTGRPRDYAEKINKSINGSRYIIYNNGGGIFDSKDRKVLYENGMNKKDILDLYNIDNVKDVRFILASNGTRYVNKVKHYDEETLIEESMKDFLNKNVVIQVTIASSDFDLIKSMRKDINLVSNIKIANQSKSLIDSKFTKIGTIYYDITNESTSKGDAIKHFCEIFNIIKENRVCIGDDKNDVSMFKECGYKVAMNNGLDCLKEIANYITDDNNNDGVAKFLEILCNKK